MIRYFCAAVGKGQPTTGRTLLYDISNQRNSGAAGKAFDSIAAGDSFSKASNGPRRAGRAVVTSR